jgi:hypothetical protein
MCSPPFGVWQWQQGSANINISVSCKNGSALLKHICKWKNTAPEAIMHKNSQDFFKVLKMDHGPMAVQEQPRETKKSTRIVNLVT